ncbi:lethal(3)malignant brain tumor-like protein 4 [Diorhabda carinulata]|uniref:lethal(3)malignant brain tumor-like protein 4 n=1 Tax=Diorhabda carinulata TaxID=1163345 RepID=UPI0025A1C85E|nr:lethal(3)malignant brain tumor-like protein 4 [Diorhabda carinulata]XP_057664538.1 lethal(3)malignant brain tumor-like protein 4 [Diorhabda carinulata]
MSSFTSTELTISREDLDTSKININSNSNHLIIENNSPDVTISKCDPPTSVTMKTQVLPLVYIQNNSKTSFSSVNKSNSNVIVNNFQLATVDHNGSKSSSNVTTSLSLTTNPNVIFTTNRQTPLVIHKPQGNMVPLVPVTVSGGTKIAGVFTMLKPSNKLNETNTILNNNNVNTFIQSQNQQQKFLFAPMPKLTTNRLATTTTSTVQPKLAILPMPVPISEPVVTQPKVYNNFKISDGQIQVEPSMVMCNSENSVDGDSNSEEKLVCDEVIDLDSPEKNDLTNKTYELSITEDSVGSQSEIRTSVILNKLPTKFPKHGVSILKKNYNYLDRKTDKTSNLLVSNNNAGLISDNKETNIDCEVDNSVVISIPAPQKPQEKERRRKSTLTCIKGYDEMEVTSTDGYGNEIISKQSSIEITKEESKKNLTSEVEIELIKEKPFLKLEDCDLQKVLTWDDGIGTLPGSEIKFILNEFNLIEYITESEYKAIIDKRMAKAKEKMKTDYHQEEMRCLECGCYGLSSDFINPKFCSYDCRDNYQNKLMKKEKADRFKKKKKKTKTETDIIKLEDESEEDSMDNNVSQDKFMSYPWACKKKGFSWSKYLEHVKAKPAPVKLFKDPFPYTRNGFRPGMKLEGVDPQHPSYFCVLTVAEVVGYRIRLHFDGYPDNYDFWCNADSMDIFPMGWCEKYGHVLQPPSGYTVDNFNWFQYLKYTKSTAAPKHLFANRAGQAICPNGFRVGMKLEAVDRKNTSLVCVATIRDMMDNRILVHFDSWDDIYDYWADPTSPYIHPVGWCDQYGHNLTPPNDYPNPESFSWETYLKESKAVAAPVRAFKQRPACGFKRGMRLESVDRRVPQLIRVATVDDVKEHQIRIHFDGWPDRYSYWVDDDSPDIHPMGWCQKTGHPIEPPLTPDDVYDFLECPTVGCRGQGHIKGPKFAVHSTPKYCPYSDENLDIEKIVPDRLLSPDKSPAAVVPVSREPKECKIKPRPGRPPKHPRPEPKPASEDEVEEEEEEEEEEAEPPEKKPTKETPKLVKKELDVKSVEQSAREFIERANIVPAERKSWAKHSEFLQKYIKTDFDPRLWSNREVVSFVSNIPGCNKISEVFRREDIDGEALLLLSQKDILTILKIKVGPALKLYNSILLLRQQVFKKLFS